MQRTQLGDRVDLGWSCSMEWKLVKLMVVVAKQAHAEFNSPGSANTHRGNLGADRDRVIWLDQFLASQGFKFVAPD